MSNYNITLKENISFEEYQMAIKVLEAMGVKEKEDDFTEAQKESIMRGIEQAEKGLFKSHSEVMEKAKKICGL